MWSRSVLIHAGCYNKMTETERVLNKRNLFLTVSRIKALVYLVSGEHGPLPGSQMCLFLCVFAHGRRVQGALWGLFYECTNLTHEGSTLMT